MMMKKFLFVIVALIVLASCNSQMSTDANALMKKGEYKAAIAMYDEYLLTKPKDIKALYNRGRAYEELGQIERAKTDFIKILDIDQNNINANMSMGKYWYNKEDFRQAINFFEKVLNVDNTKEQAYMLRGRSHHKMGQFKEAVQNYNVVIELNNKNQDAYLYRGALRVSLGQSKRACDDFTRSRALGSDEAGSAFNKYCKN